MSVLLDAGPSLNFLAVGQQNILIRIAESQKLRLAAPARVDSEVIGMSRRSHAQEFGPRDNGHRRRLDLWSTRRVLRAAGREQGWITGGLTWEQVYDQMITYDDGLIPRSQWRAKS